MLTKPPFILIIEDNYDLGQLFVEILSMENAETELIHDGREALERLQDLKPDIIILDLNLPYVSGKEILEIIRRDERLAEVRVVVVTANTIMGEVVDKLADLVLIKPISLLQVSTLVQRLLTTSP